MAKPPIRKPKKKVCLFCQEKISHVDYKDTGLLRKYMSDRGKIRARRVSGNCTQHQRDVAIAIKTARELVLLPYTQRTTTERPGGRGGGRGGREGGYGGQGGAGRGRRDEERSLSADATSNAVADDAPREPTVAVIDEVVEVTGTGDGTVTESRVEETVVEGGEA